MWSFCLALIRLGCMKHILTCIMHNHRLAKIMDSDTYTVNYAIQLSDHY